MAAKKKHKRQNKNNHFLGITGIFASVIFIPTTILLITGMIPTIVALLIDRTKKRTKALTVGAMNFAGCSPFLLDLWTEDHSIETALNLISNPRTIVIMYAAAGIGYLINWSMSGIVEIIMVQRSALRMKDIAKKQENLIVQWGKEVSGDIPIDEQGFPLEQDDLSSEGHSNL